MKETNYKRKILLIAVILVIINMVLATQYAVTKISYEYYIVHPSDSDIRYIGSDNTTGGRVLRIAGSNLTGSLKIVLGNWSPGTNKIYSAAFGIVNEEDVPLSITYINVSSSKPTYFRIWLHGDRNANANNTNFDRTTVLMYNNGTIVNASDTIAWTMAPGDGDSKDMCSNVSDRTTYSIPTGWDKTAHVRYSTNNSIAYGVNTFGRTSNNASDYVWIQIAMDIPNNVDSPGLHDGTIWIHFTADTNP